MFENPSIFSKVVPATVNFVASRLASPLLGRRSH
jgi:hypothetical protein